MASPYEDALNTIGQMDQRLANWQNVEEPQSLALPSESNPTHPGLGLTESPTSGGVFEQGLGLAQRGLEAITPSRDTLYKFAQGLEAAGAVGRGATPLYLQQQHQDLQRQQLAEAANERKQMVALRIQEQQEQKRQHDMGLLEKTLGGTHPPGVKKEMLDQLGNDPKFLMASQARQLSKALKDADYDSFDAYKDFIPQDVQAQFIDGTLPQAELSAWVDHGRDAAKVNAKETAKARIVTDAMNTPPEKRTPYMNQVVEEHVAATELKRSTIELQQSQIAKNLKEAEQGAPDRSEDNRIHQALHGTPWEQGTQATRQAALNFKGKLYAAGKQEVTENIPVSQTGKAQELRDPVTGKAAPGWATPRQLAGIGVVNIEPGQIPTVTQLQNVDEAMKEILQSGSTLLRKQGGAGSWFDIPRGLLQMPVVDIITKYAGSPEAQLLQSAIGRITPTLSKLGGDVANVAVAEREIYAKSIFNSADTLESFAKKIESINKAQKRTRESMGFVPDEKTYIQRVITQNPNMSDEQIKAIVSERKRMFQ